MKSEKVKEFIRDKQVYMLDPRFVGYREVKALGRNNSYRAVELAEQEAEERIRKELTHWNDPKEELPQNGNTVLIRLKSLPYYAVGCYAPNSRHEYEWQTADRIIPNSMIIGWREIHENE